MNRVSACLFISLIYSASTLAGESADHNFDIHPGLVYSAADPICQLDLFIPAGLHPATQADTSIAVFAGVINKVAE